MKSSIPQTTLRIAAPRRPKVYIVEMPLRREPSTGRMVPARDVSDAARYGELVVVLPYVPGEEFRSDEALGRLREGLKDFCPEHDHLVAGLGHPLAMAWASAIVAHACRGYYNLLYWKRTSSRYLSISARVFTSAGS